MLVNILVVCTTGGSLAVVLGLALADDGSDTVTLGALDTGDHELAVMQGGAAGTWEWGIGDMDATDTSADEAASAPLLSAGTSAGEGPGKASATANGGVSPQRYV